jgi:hypothetical protein
MPANWTSAALFLLAVAALRRPTDDIGDADVGDADVGDANAGVASTVSDVRRTRCRRRFQP